MVSTGIIAMTSDEISELQRLISTGSDARALERLYLYFYPKLFSFAKTMVAQAEPAEEIVEDVFIKLWENRAELGKINNLKVYLFVAVRNKSLNYLEWKSRDIISYLETYPVDIPTANNTPDYLMMTKEMAMRINKAVESLPPKCKLIFTLVREEQLKYREVADILNISPRTVDTQMTIATKKIASAINLYLTSAT